ncbi:hypothetical protein BBJ41_21515 [Burkholderia stabilis]|uniref:hypothetical protein n=1 Tax=Burkholderia stabilis TaxID=95485 RepID=UPI000851C5C2|nr:hypothetical protein [Burkholderia stabilis]AOR70157.1 hypothetical protein BBJ41_21515 [Burkholderia stabilis]HDR9489327.1 hypothetical protein [Burkholderia stabilis]HDR9522043.1 hypothetical protein [Burkholderia stabilis]HDR9529102.1 hypothetical protein [Burkholderia stabilis]HDR9535485.1 hypothetical protein [Burkholderia stabilis]
MTRRLNGRTAQAGDARRGADASAAREIVRLLGGAASHVLNGFACLAPALASNEAQVVADRRERAGHVAGTA